MSWGCVNCEVTNVDTRKTCVQCNEPRPKQDETKLEVTCEHCGTPTIRKELNYFHLDTMELRDRGAHICASCWIPALRRRSTCEHMYRQGKRGGEKCVTCEGEITSLREKFREHMRVVEARASRIEVPKEEELPK